MKLGSLAFRNIFRNFRRSLLSATAIAVASMSIVLLYSLLGGMEQDMKYNLQTYSTGAIRIRNLEFTKYERLNPMHLTVENPETLGQTLYKINGVSAISPRIGFPARIYKGDATFNAMGLGVNFETEGNFQDLGDAVVQTGRLPREGQNEALLGYKLAQEIGVTVGDKLTILSTTAVRGTNAITLTISGVAVFPFPALNEKTFYAPLDRVQYFLKMPNQVQEILIKTNEAASASQIAEIMRGWPGMSAELEIMDWKSIDSSYSMIEMASTVYGIMALFFFLLGSTVILNTTIMIIYERMKEIGTLGAMGMSGRQLVTLFFLESLYISIIASFLGVALGMIITVILQKTGIDLTASMEGVDIDISSVLYPQLSLKSTVLVFFYSVIVASITSLIPSRRVRRIEPVEALRSV
ncbi:ABC transporter permease [Oceanispirochaeta crateris]|uniref:ABC transporter permease n=1 Tax=Oceanispirochaeta crateris TaxID=2518645 RepID=A0A5C1QIN4_9SPIO|nr:FtsX-like permease family protein [Oceanispirochaeta crateris]QEN06890.1 ABC transporter permease [Oceanispirochaeta crateris]